MVDELPNCDYYIPSECYITPFDDKDEINNIILSKTIDILLPNGRVIKLDQKPDENLKDIRLTLKKKYNITWSYQFSSITHTSNNDDGDVILDESQPIEKIGLVYAFLRIDKGEQKQLCPWVSVSDRFDLDHLNYFSDNLCKWRDSTIAKDILEAPPLISNSSLSNIDEFPVYVKRLDKSFLCDKQMKPNDLLRDIITDDVYRQKNFDYFNSCTEQILRFSYRNELLSNNNYPLLQYSYVQECLIKNQEIHVEIMQIEIPKENVKEKVTFIEPNIFMQNNPQTNQRQIPQLISENNENFGFHFRLPPSSSAKQQTFTFRLGLYYGRRRLFQNDDITWNNTTLESIPIITPLKLCQLLPGTLLCLSLTSVASLKKLETYFLNLSIFRSNGYLMSGTYEYLFNPAHNLIPTHHLYPSAFIGSASITNDKHYEIKIKFSQHYDCIRFYTQDEIDKELSKIDIPRPTSISSVKRQINDTGNSEALNYLLGILSEQTEYDVPEPSWFSQQNDWSSAPIDSLPCVIHSAVNQIHTTISQSTLSLLPYDKLFYIYKLIELWPQISMEMSFFLLDCTLPDGRIRSYSVSKLEQLPDHEFIFYLPQIIQAMHFELYVDTPLNRLILKRSLCNRTIGQRLFWSLTTQSTLSASITSPDYLTVKSPEQKTAPNIFSRNGRILLELYKIYCGINIFNDLQTQLRISLRLSTINQRIRGIDRHGSESQSKKSSSELKQQLLFRLKEQNPNTWCCVSPFDSSCLYGELLIDECNVFDSFMKPFKLVWLNALNSREKFEIIYKIGDDLRQDVLTLQLFRLFDNIWKQQQNEKSLNLYMTFYDILCTSDKTGYIRIVPNAHTILNIYHKFNTTTTYKHTVVYNWLANNCTVNSNKSISKVHEQGKLPPTIQKIRHLQEIDNNRSVPPNVLNKFRKSCAAYCTAGYVIGLGDRHPSNIMITNEGQLFHIDFGHILGDYVKFGMVARETTSIILVDHFLYVITNRQMSNLKENEHYKEFIHICLETFRLLRENASAIFGLLYLCIYQQMPLLNSIQNLNYIRQALFLTDKPCEMHMALNTYRKKIELARNDTRRFLDWIAHSLVHKPVHN